MSGDGDTIREALAWCAENGMHERLVTRTLAALDALEQRNARLSAAHEGAMREGAKILAERDAAVARAEAAERERDKWLTPYDGSGIEWHKGLPSPYTYKASDFSALLCATHEYEARALAAEREAQRYRQALQQMEEVCPDCDGAGSHTNGDGCEWCGRTGLVMRPISEIAEICRAALAAGDEP